MVAAGVLLAGLGPSRPEERAGAWGSARAAERALSGQETPGGRRAGEIAELQLALHEGHGGHPPAARTEAGRQGGSPGRAESSLEMGLQRVEAEGTAPAPSGVDFVGRSRASGGWVNGLRHGVWIIRDRAGVTRERGAYDAGRRVGAWETYSASGALVQTTEFLEGEMHGDWRAFSSDGALIGEGRHHHNARSGEWTMWYSDGRVKERGAYLNGLRDGLWEFFDDLGVLTQRSGTYRAGVKLD